MASSPPTNDAPDRDAPAAARAPERARRRGGWRRWVARLFALLALAAAAVAIVLAVKSVHAEHVVTQAEATKLMARMAQANQALSSQLGALRRGQSPKQAQQANRNASNLAKQLDGDTSSSGDLGAAVHAVFDAEAAYLDAVGSSLNNPHSVLLGKVGRRAQAVRDALVNAPGGVPGSVSGATALVAYSRTRG